MSSRRGGSLPWTPVAPSEGLAAASLVGFLLTPTAFEDGSSSADDQLAFKTEQSPLGGMFSVLSCRLTSQTVGRQFGVGVWRIS